jgi:hypothetical protein
MMMMIIRVLLMMMNDNDYDHDVDETDLIRTDRMWFDVSRLLVLCHNSNQSNQYDDSNYKNTAIDDE